MRGMPVRCENEKIVGREEGREGRCPLKDRRITDQYHGMDFVILNGAVRDSLTPTCSEL